MGRWRTYSIEPTRHLGLGCQYVVQFSYPINDLVHGLDVLALDDGNNIGIAEKGIGMHDAMKTYAQTFDCIVVYRSPHSAGVSLAGTITFARA